MTIPDAINKKSFELNAAGLQLSLQQPIVMGILNITPNSFFDGGKYNIGNAYLKRAEEIYTQGARIIDIGAVSTRPGSALSNPDEEWARLEPVITDLRKRYPNTMLSVDTYHASLVSRCADTGVNIINDISGGAWDIHMYEEIAKYDMAYVLMHTQGKPKDMQQNPQYKDVVKEVLGFFEQAVATLNSLDFHNIIIDPGFGFGKTIAHNYKLLAHLETFHTLDLPLLAGLSRKSMLFKPLDTTAQEVLNATTVVNTLAINKGAHILRVHDVKEAVELIKIYDLYEQGI